MSNASKRSRTHLKWEQLEEDIRELGALIRGGMSAHEALVELRRRLDADSQRDFFAHTAMAEILRGSAISQVLEEADMPRKIAVAAYRCASSMLEARSEKGGA